MRKLACRNKAACPKYRDSREMEFFKIRSWVSDALRNIIPCIHGKDGIYPRMRDCVQQHQNWLIQAEGVN
jgi:hypothetical protein